MIRNITLDYFKLILSFFVIMIHCPILKAFPLYSWELSFGISRIAVPCFFVINGYFMQAIISDKARIKHYFIRLLTMYIVWQIIYLPFQIDTLLQGFSIGKIKHHHLWYILGLFCGSLLLYVFYKLKTNRYIVLGLALILAVTVVVTERMGINGFDGIRRYFFSSFPFLAAGAYAHEMNLEKTFRVNFICISLSILLFIGLIFEAYLLFSQSRFGEFYFAPILLAPLIILIILKSGTYKQSDGFVSKLAGSVYFVHIMIIWLIQAIFGGMDSTGQYILVIFFSLIVSAVLVTLNKYLKIFF